MPSPFPGVDPYLEGQNWSECHCLLIAELHRVLVARLRPRYVVRMERRVYLKQPRESYLEIRLADSGVVVAVVELLSPTNKRPNSDGRREYLRKREEVLSSRAHLLELDLLRGGSRLPMAKPLPRADFYLMVNRHNRRPWTDVWPFNLRDPIPPLPVPLAGDDPDVVFDLESAFSTVYDQAGYDYSLDYTRGVVPALTPDDQAWAEERLSSR